MRSLRNDFKFWRAWLVIIVLTAISGCNKSPKETTASATPLPPKEAANQIQKAFSAANVEVKTTATAFSEAIRTADYPKAIHAIETIKTRKDLTFEQGVAVYNSEVALEAALLARVAANDPAAKQAYEELKKSKRN